MPLCPSLCVPLCPGELTFKTSLQVRLILRRVAPLTRPPRGPRCRFGCALRMQAHAVGNSPVQGPPDLRAAPASSLIALTTWSRMLVGQALKGTKVQYQPASKVADTLYKFEGSVHKSLLAGIWCKKGVNWLEDFLVSLPLGLAKLSIHVSW